MSQAIHFSLALVTAQLGENVSYRHSELKEQIKEIVQVPEYFMISGLISMKSIIYMHIFQCIAETRVKATHCGRDKAYS